MSTRASALRPRAGLTRPRHAERAADCPQDLDARKANRPWLRAVLRLVARALSGGACRA